MFKWVYKIILVVIAVSFFISATELSIGKCRNTFFDNYDTYVRTEQVSFDHITAASHNNDDYFLVSFTRFYFLDCSYNHSVSEYYFNSFFECYPQKLYLRYSVWRI